MSVVHCMHHVTEKNMISGRTVMGHPHLDWLPLASTSHFCHLFHEPSPAIV